MKHRSALILPILAAALLQDRSIARADGFDSLINLELAFRNTILDEHAPQRYHALIRDGETTITFVRDLPDSVGKTDFFLNLDWSYDYRYSIRTTDEVAEISVNAAKVKLTPRMRHLIRLPIAFYRAGVWESKLLGHEFDHVAVSLDPRPRALLVHMCNTLPTYRFSMVAEKKPSDEQLREGINLAIQRRLSAILELVQANYVALDKTTQHGRTAMERRREFFESLYTRSNLEAEEFPFLNEVAEYLDSHFYRNLNPRHVPADPATSSRR